MRKRARLTFYCLMWKKYHLSEKNIFWKFLLYYKRHPEWFFLRNMPTPCSNDLRWQIVWLVLGIRKTTHETTRLMGVTRRTVVNILQRFRRYGSVRPSRIGRPNTMSSITRGELFVLMEYVMRYPGAYLREAINYIEGICGREFSASSLWRCLKRCGFTRRKVTTPNL